jgi:hypothetical protein
MWNLVSVYLEIVLGLVQDKCTVCAEHTIGSGIILDAHDGTARLLGPCGISFVYLQTVLIWMQDWCKVCAERTVGSEIILDASDGTPR